jgi:UDP-N-acetylglucosamine 2-epimerase (non-hydrolysing)
MEREAFCVLSDSGTVQEECAIFGVPNVTLRDVTERPETLECGSGLLSGAEPGLIPILVKLATQASQPWAPPAEYVKTNVSETVARIVMGFLLRR